MDLDFEEQLLNAIRYCDPKRLVKALTTPNAANNIVELDLIYLLLRNQETDKYNDELLQCIRILLSLGCPVTEDSLSELTLIKDNFNVIRLLLNLTIYEKKFEPAFNYFSYIFSSNFDMTILLYSVGYRPNSEFQKKLPQSIQNMAKEPNNLQKSCKLVIRRVIGKNLMAYTRVLPIPQLLKDYLVGGQLL
ncbi:unnamed protein product [Dimorphilus gyrociliatus]|uniref:SOCS box domain-containing protein n=1 Tax=Dimorphilus gyrociliatus TaxID=2664684 RepID=A0A7I8VQI5_9ANNE|nr:unnamed protein product [Dimorphilus gyrociliatus]